MLAAVDLLTEDARHKKLNDVVLQQADTVAKLVGTDFSIVSAYQLTRHIKTPGSLSDSSCVARERIKKSRTVVQALVEPYDVPDSGINIEQGVAADVINEVANRSGAGMIVIGTVARTGIGGSLFGNTAEGVLEGASANVLIVKLPNFDD
ncbi:MAG TPA: hypothetical protein EYG52_12880 [Pseudomonadales bacterium]|jgi:nucleotide-binding universal stress UspA family protein|nr:hypothetical protein [Gammaproteobacteria bacterium]HIL84389.1 hypothetical protein [Pseudomonadales bacterium]